MGDGLEGLPQPHAVLAPERQRVVRTLVRDRPLALHDLTDDVDVLAGAGEGLAERLPVPALDDLWTGHAQAQHVAPTTEVVEGEGGHGRSRWGATRQLHDRGAQADAGRLRPPPRQGCEAVGAPRLGGEDAVEAQPLGLEDALERV